MQIVSDRGMDLSSSQSEGLCIHLVPLTLTLAGKSYRSGVDISPEKFYDLLASSESFPTTSQPSPADFADLYRCLAAADPEILSIHISSGLSGTIETARMGAEMVPEASVTIVDTKTLSGAQGWQVEAAARGIKAGWSKTRILEQVERIGIATETVFTVATLKYLIHGGRISHLKGLLASLLNIKPIIGVEKTAGKYVNHDQARTMEQALRKLADYAASLHKPGSTLRLQIMHGHNAEGASMLQEYLARLFKCVWLPSIPIAPVLGAHTGPGLVGLAFAPEEAFAALP